MIYLLEQLTFWHWLGFGLVLMLGELLGTAGYLLWTGLAALVVGVVLWILPDITWQWQLVIFSVISLIAAFAWWRWLESRDQKPAETVVNNRVARYIGRTIVLEEPITGGRGRICLDDSYWQVTGDDLPEGVRVKVVGADSMTLQVEPFE